MSVRKDMYFMGKSKIMDFERGARAEQIAENQ